MTDTPVTLHATDFEDKTGQSFTICRVFEDDTESDFVELTLDSCERKPIQEFKGRTRDPFLLVFRGPDTPALDQGTYTVRAEGLGRINMFLIPLGPTGDGHMAYQAIYN